MPRYALRIEYHGAAFAGWQRQSGQRSVQEAVEAALSRLDPGVTAIAAAGRTDAGVHASGQVAHCDLARAWEPFRLMEALNSHLRPDLVAVTAAAQVPEDFHARFSARHRRYLYRIAARRAPPVLAGGLVWHVRRPLAVASMQAAALHLIGHHDFSTFRSSICQSASPVKTLDRLDIEEVAGAHGPEIHFHVAARSFLHNQVRSFVGTLVQVGAGSWTPEDVKAALAARDRAACGPVAPPQGLMLVEVGYAPDPFA